MNTASTTNTTPATNTTSATNTARATSAVAPRRRMGANGPELPILSLGSWHTFDRIEFRDSVELVTDAVERGVSLFDVGVYAFPGMPPVFTDVLFSAIVRASGLPRESLQVSCKLWLEGYPEQALEPQLRNALFRAGLEYADIAMLGDVRDEAMDLDRLLDDMAGLIDAGLIQAWGVSNWPAGTLLDAVERAAARGVAAPQMVQLKYSVARRAITDGDPYRAVFEAGVTLQASDVLEGGILAGNAQPTRQIGRDPGSIREQIIDSLPEFRALADSLGVAPAQLAVAFTLTHPHLTTVLFGASKKRHVHDALGALELVDSVGAERIRELVEPFWADRGIVDPAGA